ncbi:hypothetical protein FRC03_008544, partial [Tulasnella sp. 419]
RIPTPVSDDDGEQQAAAKDNHVPSSRSPRVNGHISPTQASFHMRRLNAASSKTRN